MPNNRNRNRNNRRNNNNNNNKNRNNNNNNNTNTNANNKQSNSRQSTRDEQAQTSSKPKQQPPQNVAPVQQQQQDAIEQHDDALASASANSSRSHQETEAANSANDSNPKSNDHEPLVEQQQGQHVDENSSMGQKSSKNANEEQPIPTVSPTNPSEDVTAASSPTADATAGAGDSNTSSADSNNGISLPHAKVIIHRIVREEGEADDCVKSEAPEREGTNAATRDAAVVSDQGQQQQEHSNDEQQQMRPQQQQQEQSKAKVIIHRIYVEEPPTSSDESSAVQSPCARNASGVQIQEMDDTFSISGEQQQQPTPLVSEVESEVESLSSPTPRSHTAQLLETLPLPDVLLTPESPLPHVADEEDTQPQTPKRPDDDTRQRRAQKIVALEAHFLPQWANPRYLDAIVEENSDVSDAFSDCSSIDQAAGGGTLQRSHSGKRKARSEAAAAARTAKANAVFPKSSLDFSRTHKHGEAPLQRNAAATAIIAEEPTAVVFVASKYVGELCEPATTLVVTGKQAAESEAAELVYINSSASSSVSDLAESIEAELQQQHLLLDQQHQYLQAATSLGRGGDADGIDLDTDASEIISKPSAVVLTPLLPCSSADEWSLSTTGDADADSEGESDSISNAASEREHERARAHTSDRDDSDAGDGDGDGERHNERECTPVNQPSTSTTTTTALTPSPSSSTSDTTTAFQSIDNTNTKTTTTPTRVDRTPNASAARNLAHREQMPELNSNSNTNGTSPTPSPPLTLSGLAALLPLSSDSEVAAKRLASVQSFVANASTSTSSTATSTTTDNNKKNAGKRTRTVRSTEVFKSTVEHTISSNSRAEQHSTCSSTTSTSSSKSSSSRVLNSNTDNPAANTTISAPAEISNTIDEPAMNNVRDILNSQADTVTSSTVSQPPQVQRAKSPTPPPVPPPPSSSVSSSVPPLPPVRHNAVVGSSLEHTTTTTTTTTTANTNTHHTTNTNIPNATTSLLKPGAQLSLSRQESADSQCSVSTTHSQCTTIAKGAGGAASPTISDTDMPTSSFISEHPQPGNSDNEVEGESGIKKLRMLCAETLASMPYGDEVLEELATVAENIGEVRASTAASAATPTAQDLPSNTAEMPYPRPQLPHIGKLQLSLAAAHQQTDKQTVALISEKPNVAAAPVTAAPAAWVGLPTEANPQLLVCLSPAQQTHAANTAAASQPDALLEAHQNFVERRGYHEYSVEQMRDQQQQEAGEQRILETAAVMRKLRKSLTPTPPPLPPPPVPTKSNETAAKAQQHQQQQASDVKSDYDTSFANANEQRQQQQQQQRENHFEAKKPFTFDGESAEPLQYEQNRLLAIIHNAADDIKQTLTSSTSNNNSGECEPTTEQAKTAKTASTSSFENNSRQSEYDNNNNSGSKTRTSNYNNPNNQNNSIPAAQVLGEQQQQQEKHEEEATQQHTYHHHHEQHHQQQSIETFKRDDSDIVGAAPTAVVGRNSQKSPTPPPRPPAPETQSTSESHTIDNNMQSIETELGRMFPVMGETNIFDKGQKRFSNIESSTSSNRFPRSLVAGSGSGAQFDGDSTVPRRYSSVETSSYETKKRIENGQVVYDVSTSNRSSQQFPPTTSTSIESEMAKRGHRENGEIMSAFNLNASEPHHTPQPPSLPSSIQQYHASADPTASLLNSTSSSQAASATTKLSNASTTESKTEIIKNSQKMMSESSINSNVVASKDATDNASYEEFRQRAKAAAATAPVLPVTGATSAFHFDQDKLFKDFDDLSRRLDSELAESRARRQMQNEKSTSLFDLSSTPTLVAPNSAFRTKFDDFRRERHEHMKELENEIERSMRSRQLRMSASPNPMTQQQPQQQQSSSRTYEIPIQFEGQTSDNVRANVNQSQPRTYDIPIQIELPYQVNSPLSSQQHQQTATEQDCQRRYRRAESMFNLTERTAPLQPPQGRQRSVSLSREDPNCQMSGAADDWARYASDLGSSENITRPFAREVEICYQRLRPNTIRAPRLTASTNDLYRHQNSNNTYYDVHNAYSGRRTHAPMLGQVPQRQYNQPQYASCYSVLQRDPNPTYISTTSRRGVSPALQPQLYAPPLTHFGAQQQSEAAQPPPIPQPRRASLPREIHEQQLKYISSKEEELRTEIDRLQYERKRLQEEMLRTPNAMPQMVPPPRPMRDTYRTQVPRLPTLSEDEVFRQQMAEEWLNKVAEREERRLHKIIKISKAHEDELHASVGIQGQLRPDIGEEFLSRVRERRSKLAMPSDSDWESGAESQPVPRPGNTGGPNSNSDVEDLPPVRVLEGQNEADLKRLPKHLREFARFSNHQTEQLENGQREVQEEEERRHEVSDNSMSRALKKTSVVKTVKVTRPDDLIDAATIVDSPTTSDTYNTNTNTDTNTTNIYTTTNTDAKHSTEGTKPTRTISSGSDDEERFWSTSITSNNGDESPMFHHLPKIQPPTFSSPTFNEWFANSPFRDRIHEEFANYWRHFRRAAMEPPSPL